MEFINLLAQLACMVVGNEYLPRYGIKCYLLLGRSESISDENDAIFRFAKLPYVTSSMYSAICMYS